MADIMGTNVSAKIVPFTTEDQFATHVSTYGQGGWHEVADNTERDNIPADRRLAGMAVFVTADKKLYTLNSDLTTWSEVESGKVDDIQINGTSIVQNKVANITVEDNTTSTSTTNPLSANVGRELQEQINNLSGRGRYLSLWNCTTGLAETLPTVDPYPYKTGDYFIIGTVATQEGEVNYRPYGTEYSTSDPSTVVETKEVEVDDTYVYDGLVWHLLKNNQKDLAFTNIAGSPYDNAELANALNSKADETSLEEHIQDTNNPHQVTKEQVGLGNVDNTSDVNKPISTATQLALDNKVDKTNSASKVYGTDNQGEQTTYDVDSFGKVDDVKVNGVSVVENKEASITIGDASLTITKSGVAVGSFSANATVDVTLDVDTDILPTQAGNEGKFLNTDGSHASWQEVKPIVWVSYVDE